MIRGTKRTATQQKCDTMWSELIKLRAGNKCEYCGKTDTLNSHHIFSRSNMTTRWDEENGICLCVLHHVFGQMSAHKAPIEFYEWLREKRGEDWFNRVRLKAKQVGRHIDKESVKMELELKLKKQKGEAK